jgi:hypothetical protein
VRELHIKRCRGFKFLNLDQQFYPTNNFIQECVKFVSVNNLNVFRSHYFGNRSTGYLMHSLSGSSLLRDGLWRRGVDSTSVLTCNTFGFLWPMVRSWIGFSEADAHSLTDHFLQFTYSAGCIRAWRSFLQLVCLVCVWVVWNERNLIIFRNSASTVDQLLNKVKLFTYRWFRVTDVTLATSLHCWWSSHLLCLGID